jgi:hypothetical protein
MEEQEMFFERLKAIKDYWVQTSMESLNLDADLIWSENRENYLVLQNILKSEESKKAYMSILDENIKGAIHSILVMLDGGDELADSYCIDLINANTKKSLKDEISLHEEFFSYLVDKE